MESHGHSAEWSGSVHINGERDGLAKAGNEAIMMMAFELELTLLSQKQTEQVRKVLTKN